MRNVEARCRLIQQQETTTIGYSACPELSQAPRQMYPRAPPDRRSTARLDKWMTPAAVMATPVTLA